MSNIFIYIGYFFLVVNLILFLKGYSNNGKAFKIFTIYTVVIFFIQLVSFVLAKRGINNLFLSHLYFIFQFVILSFFYLAILKEEVQKKIVKLFLILCPMLLLVQYVKNCSLFFEFNLFEIFITSLLLVLYATFHLFNILYEKKEFYYINVGVLIYLFSSSVLFLAGNLNIKLNKEFDNLSFIINLFIYIIYQIFILIEWKKSFSKNTISSE